MLYDKQATQHSECRRRDGEKVQRCNCLPVIPKEGQPKLAGFVWARWATQIARNGAL